MKSKPYISRLHVITQDLPHCSHIEQVEEACKADCDWLQLRVKNRTEDEIMEIADHARQITLAYDVDLIINDYTDIARRVGADGVHLGKTDMHPSEARDLIGSNNLIGGTANTMEDIKRLAGLVDYIGLGPYSFTKTKETLSPVLGLHGYKEIANQCIAFGIDVPLIAIGGIEISDVVPILETGIYGIAVSSAIVDTANIEDAIDEFECEMGDVFLFRNHTIKNN